MRLAEFDAPGGVVAHVVRVVDLAVEQFHDEGDAEFLGERQEALEADGAVFEALFVGHAIAVAGEADDLFGAGGGGGLEVRFVDGDEGVVVFEAVEGASRCGRPSTPAGVLAVGKETMAQVSPCFSQDGQFVRHEQLDGLDAHFLGGDAEIFERDVVVTPPADRVVDAGHFRWS